MKNRGDEPSQVIIHIHGNVRRKLLVCHFFSFIKSENKKAKQVLPEEDGTSGSREEVRKGVQGEYSANTVYRCM
jgi:hypothetical protein